MTDSIPPAAARLAQDIRAQYRALKRRLREQAGLGDMTPSQNAVVVRLDADGVATASELARAEGMRPQSMGPIVAALEAAGLVQGAPDPADGRRTLLSLTPACREQLRERRAARQDWLARTIAARLTREEEAELARGLALIQRLVED